MSIQPDVAIIDAGGQYHLGLRDDESGQGYQRLFGLRNGEAFALIDAGYKRVKNSVASPIILSEGDPEMLAMLDLHPNAQAPHYWTVVSAGSGVIGQVHVSVAQRMSKTPHVCCPNGVPADWATDTAAGLEKAATDLRARADALDAQAQAVRAQYDVGTASSASQEDRLSRTPDVAIVRAGGANYLGLWDAQSGQGYQRLCKLTEIEARGMIRIGLKSVKNGVAAPMILSRGDPDMTAMIDLHQDEDPNVWLVVLGGFGVVTDVKTDVAERMSRAPVVCFPEGTPTGWGPVQAHEDADDRMEM